MPQAAWRELSASQQKAVIAATRELFAVAEANPSISRQEFEAAYQAIVADYGSVTAELAVNAIAVSRQAAEVWDVLPEPLPAALPPVEQVSATFSWAVNRAIGRGDTSPLAVAHILAGPLGRLVQQPARETIYDATRAAGTRYARLPGPKACAFCLMLASRGAVYTRQTVLTTGGTRPGVKERYLPRNQLADRGHRYHKGRRPEGLKFHDHCDCTAIESYSDADLPKVILDLQDEWYETTWINGQPAPNQRELWNEHIRDTRPNHETIRPPDVVRLSAKRTAKEAAENAAKAPHAAVLHGSKAAGGSVDTPGWLPLDAQEIRQSPRRNRGPHQTLNSSEILEKHGLLNAPSTRADARRSKKEAEDYEKEEKTIQWLREHGAKEVMRVGKADEADPELPEDNKRTPDLIVDGVPVEVKSPTRLSAIQKRVKAGARQAAVVVVDARGTGITKEVVDGSAKNVVRDYGDRLDWLVIIVEDGTLYSRRRN